jgi:transaldolase
VTLETVDACRDRGEPKARLGPHFKDAHSVLGRLTELGISIDNVIRQLEDEGAEKFIKPFEKLMETVAQGSARHFTRQS